MCDASDNDFLTRLEDEFGLEGYARWFKLCEAVGRGSDPKKGKWSVAHPWSKWQTILKGKRKKLETFLGHSEIVSRTNQKLTGNILEIEIPKMRELRDNYSKDLQAANNSPRTRKKEAEEEEEKEYKNPPSPLQGGGGAGQPENKNPDPKPKPKSKRERKRFAPPTVEEVQAYCHGRSNGIDAGQFCDFYESKGWMVGSNKMKDWKAAVRTWERDSRRSVQQATLKPWENDARAL